ncbi:glutamine--fructose-6-phosphate transaminase (isomerizing) [Candidatus Woesearchaeota archaeon]|nr:glutamine--fructose-6-phosphate transaminase (isomerizing) [Candidatus Woesearchaeota archaeon]
MCGIVAYKGKEGCSDILLSCIKNLEYRGYDSIGMALAADKSNSIEIRKDVGPIDLVDEKLNFTSMQGNKGIAHTRWATTGSVTKENSHPHFSSDQKVYVVHNGIIENYQELRKELTDLGITLNSETDSEVIPQFIAIFVKEGSSLIDAIRKTILKIKGSFAIVGMHEDEEGIFFARKESPLVIGMKETSDGSGEKEFFAASDVPAFLSYTNEVYYIEDNEYGIIKEDIVFRDIIDNKIIKKEIQHINWDIDQAKKGEYAHFMLKEIHEQKNTIVKSIQQPSSLVEEVSDILKNAFGIFFVGCGTSYHAAVSASYVFTHVAKRHVNVTIASEFRNYKDYLTDKTVVVAISQSGETADLIDAIKTAKEKGSKVVSIVNVMGSTITRMSDKNIMMNAGPEICVLSTKSYTSQLAILLLLAHAIVDKEEKAKELIRKAGEEVTKIIDNNFLLLEKIAEKIKEENSMFLIGRDLAYPSALEGALKIKEVSYIHAEGFPGGELKHGTIALIEKGTPCIVLTTEATRDMIISNASEIKVRGGYMIGINSKENEVYDEFIKIGELGHANPIAMIIPIQILAYHLALKRGCNPDKPRNLAKSVTVK